MTSEEARALIRASGWQPHKRNSPHCNTLEDHITLRPLRARAAPDPDGGWMVGFGEGEELEYAPFSNRNCFWFPTEEQARACVVTLKVLGSMGA